MDEHELFSALSNGTRRAILRWMKDVPTNFGEIAEGRCGEVCVSAIQRKTALSQSTVSAYMATLERAGLIESRRHRQWTFFKRNEATIAAFVASLHGDL